MHSPYEGKLPIPTVSPAAQHTDIFPDNKPGTLLSFGKLCDDGCLGVFTDGKAYILKEDKNLTKYAWKKAVNAGFFTIWHGLTADLTKKHLPKSPATVKGHIKQQRKNVRIIKPPSEKEMYELPMEKITLHTNLVLSKTICINGATGKGFDTLTHRFSIKSF
eukprot:12116814-Ditylum_brightwellii.AAC.1